MENARNFARLIYQESSAYKGKQIKPGDIDRLTTQIIALSTEDRFSELMDRDIDLNGIFDLSVKASDNIGVTFEQRLRRFQHLLASISDYYDFYIAPLGLLPNTPATIAKILSKFQTSNWRNYDNRMRVNDFIQQDYDLCVYELTWNGKQYYLVNTNNIGKNDEIDSLVKFKGYKEYKIVKPFRIWCANDEDGKPINAIKIASITNRPLNQWSLFEIL